MNKLSYIFLILLSCWQFCSAQQASKTIGVVSILEELKDSSDAVNFLRTADVQYSRQQYQQSSGSALQAYRAATKAHSSSLQAKSLYRQARADIQISVRRNKKNAQYNDANSKLKLALNLLRGSDDIQLKVEITGLMASIAQQQKNSTAQKFYLKQVKMMKEGLISHPLSDPANKAAEGIIDDIKVVLEDAKNQKDNLTDQLEDLDSLRVELSEKLELQQAKLTQLSKEQLESELLIAQQRIMVDSAAFQREMDSLRIVQQESTLYQQNSEIALQRSQRNLLIALSIIVLLIALAVWFRLWTSRRYTNKLEAKNKEIEKEKARAEGLLLNILPAEIARELQTKGKIKPRHHDQVSVLFSDFKNFTHIAAQLSSDELVTELDYCFKAFDAITRKHRLEKIKTIGDSYMCAGGLPEPDADHPRRIVAAALEMQEFMAGWKKKCQQANKPFFEARVGIHTGPVTAGVVGLDKFAYDIWGNTVNIASRMETNSEAGQVNISESTYQLVKNDFRCFAHEQLAIKNGKSIPMYFVEPEHALAEV